MGVVADKPGGRDADDLNIAATGGDTDRFLNWQTTAAGVVRITHGPAARL